MKTSRSQKRRLLVILIVSAQLAAIYVFTLVHFRTRTRLRKLLARKAEALITAIHFERLSAMLGVQQAYAEPEPHNRAIPDHFPTLEQLDARIHRLVQQNPELLSLEVIGHSTTIGLPIYAIKLSDHPRMEEDESAILFSGLHHAREPMGTLVCLHLLDELVSRYKTDPQIRKLVNQLEIWFVPIVNPDGYKYMMDNYVPYPWWRKNLHDNDGNGKFDPLIDGVDLNRNYDFNWHDGGEGNPGSWFYRGKAPFSEKEIYAVKTLALRENVMAGISFHSYGEIVLYPWGNYYPAPDHRLIIAIAKQMAARMHKLSFNENYGVLPLNGRVGQSSVWMYGRLRAIDYIVELGEEHFPDRGEVGQILEAGTAGAMYLLQAASSMGIRGHVKDALTQQPLVAKILVEGLEADYVHPRFSEKWFGRFERILAPGRYNLYIVADGYESKSLPGVLVTAGHPVQLSVDLNRKIPTFPLGNH